MFYGRKGLLNRVELRAVLRKKSKVLPQGGEKGVKSRRCVSAEVVTNNGKPSPRVLQKLRAKRSNKLSEESLGRCCALKNPRPDSASRAKGQHEVNGWGAVVGDLEVSPRAWGTS